MAVSDCDWPISIEDCCPPLPEESPDSPGESPGDSPGESPGQSSLIDKAIAQASAMMRRLSGFNVGQCVEDLRPLQICPECRSWCCGGADGIGLSGPNGEMVADILEVRIGPETVDPATYRWDREEQMLWRVPPNTWPKRDERWSECGKGKAFCVTALVGVPPDAWALSVATELACELVKSCVGAKCRIPSNATQVTAQGITVTLSEADLKALLPEVAGWAEAVNPHHAVMPAKVWSPDIDGGKHHRQRGGPRQELYAGWGPPWLGQ